MKKGLCVISAILLCTLLIGCAAPVRPGSGGFDIDLTGMSSTMVYSEVYHMVSAPDDYIGKTVRMSGNFAYIQENERYYFACIVSDATACCAQEIEFVLADRTAVFPDDYPPAGETITVAGIFDTYFEGKEQYFQLINAVWQLNAA